MIRVAQQPAHLVGDGAHELRIVPPGRWGRFDLRELWTSRELLYFMAKREIQIRYKQSFFGVAWAVLQPLALTGLFTLFFGSKISTGGVPYPVFALAGLAPWIFVSAATSQGALSLVGDANLLSKVYFPRLVLPVAKTISLLLDLAIALVVLFVFGAAYGVSVGADALAIPGFLLLAVATALGLGTFLAAVNVKYRDVAVVIPLLVMIWLFATPVIYSGTAVGGWAQYVYAINPMVSVIGGIRWAYLGTAAPSGLGIAVSVATALVFLVGGIQYFRRTEAFFADFV